MRRLRIGPNILRVRMNPNHHRHIRCSATNLPGFTAPEMSGSSGRIAKIAPSRRVLAPDPPGHGQSDPWHEQSIDLYRDAVGTMCGTPESAQDCRRRSLDGWSVALAGMAGTGFGAGARLVRPGSMFPDELCRVLRGSCPKAMTQVEAMPPSLAALAFFARDAP